MLYTDDTMKLQFSIKVPSSNNDHGVLIVCKFNDLMWSSTDKLIFFTTYKPATIIFILAHFVR